MGARSKAISKRRSASRPARSALRCSVTSRETKTIPSIAAVVACAPARSGRRSCAASGRGRCLDAAVLPGQRAREDLLGRGEQLGRDDLRQVAADHRGAVDAGASPGAGPPAAGSAGRRSNRPTDVPGEVLQREPVAALAVAQRVLGGAARAPMPVVPALQHARAAGAGRERHRAVADGSHPMMIGAARRVLQRSGRLRRDGADQVGDGVGIGEERRVVGVEAVRGAGVRGHRLLRGHRDRADRGRR